MNMYIDAAFVYYTLIEKHGDTRGWGPSPRINAGRICNEVRDWRLSDWSRLGSAARVFWEERRPNTRRSRVGAPTDLEHLKTSWLGFGLGPGLAPDWSVPTCKIEIKELNPRRSSRNSVHHIYLFTRLQPSCLYFLFFTRYVRIYVGRAGDGGQNAFDTAVRCPTILLHTRYRYKYSMKKMDNMSAGC